ncbi:MAG: radical SAM protein, partial [Chloroflexota bacterium]
GVFAFSGGEALLRKDDLLALMDRADTLPKIGSYQLLTNGSLLTEEIVTHLKGLRKLAAIQLSLESSSPEVNDSVRGKGTFEETLRAIKLLTKNGLRIKISTTISQLNYLDIPTLIKWVDQKGVDEIGFDRLIPSGKGKNLSSLTKEALQQVYGMIYSLAPSTKKVTVVMRRPLFCLIAPEDKEIGAMCSAGINNLSIMPDGTIYPCRWLPIPIGNITDVDLDQMWHNDIVLTRLRRKKERKGKCNGCPFLLKCGGCRGMAYFHSGDYLAEDPQCWR